MHELFEAGGRLLAQSDLLQACSEGKNEGKENNSQKNIGSGDAIVLFQHCEALELLVLNATSRYCNRTGCGTSREQQLRVCSSCSFFLSPKLILLGWGPQINCVELCLFGWVHLSLQARRS